MSYSQPHGGNTERVHRMHAKVSQTDFSFSMQQTKCGQNLRVSVTCLRTASRQWERMVIRWGEALIILQVAASGLDGDRTSSEASLRVIYICPWHTHTFAYMYIHEDTCIHMHMYVHVYIGTHTHICMCVFMHTHNYNKYIYVYLVLERSSLKTMFQFCISGGKKRQQNRDLIQRGT